MPREWLVRAQGRLAGVIPCCVTCRRMAGTREARSNPGVSIPSPNPSGREKGDADRPSLRGGPSRFKAGATGPDRRRGLVKSRARGSTLQGAFNVSGVGSFRPGDRRNRADDNARRSGRPRRRIAQPRKARSASAREGLAGKGNERRRRIGQGYADRRAPGGEGPTPEGYGGASVFCPRKSSDTLGNYAVPEGRTYGESGRGLEGPLAA
jgi:hypothetical protein